MYIYDTYIYIFFIEYPLSQNPIQVLRPLPMFRQLPSAEAILGASAELEEAELKRRGWRNRLPGFLLRNLVCSC